MSTSLRGIGSVTSCPAGGEGTGAGGSTIRSPPRRVVGSANEVKEPIKLSLLSQELASSTFHVLPVSVIRIVSISVLI